MINLIASTIAGVKTKAGGKLNKFHIIGLILGILFLVALSVAMQATLAAGIIFALNLFDLGIEYTFRTIGGIVLIFIILRSLFPSRSKE